MTLAFISRVSAVSLPFVQILFFIAVKYDAAYWWAAIWLCTTILLSLFAILGLCFAAIRKASALLILSSLALAVAIFLVALPAMHMVA
jgi:hypothetical protein